MMLIRNFLAVCLMSLCFSCTKKQLQEQEPAQAVEPLIIEAPFPCEDTTLNYNKLPEEPVFGFIYTLSEKRSERIWRVVYDPIDKNKIYYLTNELNNVHDGCYLWKYDRISKIKTLLAKRALMTIDVSNKGWIVFDTQDWNIAKVKNNGDSLIQLTNDGKSLYPKWSDDGRYIYYNNEGKYGGLLKMNQTGLVVQKVQNIANSSWLFQIKNYVYYYRSVGEATEQYIIQKDTITGSDRVILSPQNSMGDGPQYWYTDSKNNYLYWYGGLGFYKTDISSLNTYKLVNSGQWYSNSLLLHFRQSPLTGRFIGVQSDQVAPNPKTIKTISYIVEFSEDCKCRRKVEIPD